MGRFYISNIEEAKVIARRYISEGFLPSQLTHFQWHPQIEDEIIGISRPLNVDESLAGHIERYYTLQEVLDW